jgi:hypothetical protein
VILTIRDNPSVWYKSAKDTIFFAVHLMNSFPYYILQFFFPNVKNFVKMVFVEVWDNPILFDGKFEDQDEAEKIYIEWIEKVKANIPGSDLLVFNVKQGWEPLCRFLNVPIPHIPFPRVNEKKEFVDYVDAEIKKWAYQLFLWVLILTSCLAYLFWSF